MSRRAVASWRAIALAVLGTILCGSSLASERGYDIWFAGEVLAVNAHAGTIRIARGPTETKGAAVIDCTIVQRALHHIYRGMQVDVEADTRSEPWHIIHLRPLELRVRPLFHFYT